MAPWTEPILQAFSFLAGVRPENGDLISKLQENKKIIIKPLDYIRGATYHKSFIVIDEAQNLTPHQVKTIITRAGSNTKMVFTGDLGQIDRNRRLDRKNERFGICNESDGKSKHGRNCQFQRYCSFSPGQLGGRASLAPGQELP